MRNMNLNLRVLKLRVMMVVLTMCFLFRKHIGMLFIEARYEIKMAWIDRKYRLINLYLKCKKCIIDTFKLFIGTVLIISRNVKIYYMTSNKEEFEVFKKQMKNTSFLKPGIDFTPVAERRILQFFFEEFGIENIFEFLNKKGVKFYTLDRSYNYQLLKMFDGSFIPSVDRLVVKSASSSLFVHEAMHALQKHEYNRFGFVDKCRNFRASVFANIWHDMSYYYALDFEVEAYDIQEKYLKFVDLDMKCRSRAMKRMMDKITK